MSHPSAAPPAIIELRDIHYAYPGSDRHVLRGLNFELRHGDRLGLIGSNGAGKTTLFHVAMGLLTPSSGQVFFKGGHISGEKHFRAVRQAVGLLFQDADDQLFSPTVIEDVAFGPLNLGQSAEEARHSAETALSMLDLSHLRDRAVHRLSGGEKKLVALATILSMQPEALLLDEPTNELDPDTRERLLDILSDLPQAMAIISHDWDFLDRAASRLLAISNGFIDPDTRVEAHTHVHAHTKGDQPHHHQG